VESNNKQGREHVYELFGLAVTSLINTDKSTCTYQPDHRIAAYYPDQYLRHGFATLLCQAIST